MSVTENSAVAPAQSALPLKRLLPLAAIAAGFGAFFLLGGTDYLSLQKLAENRDALQAWASASPILAAAAYMALYIAVTALSLPAGTVHDIEPDDEGSNGEGRA